MDVKVFKTFLEVAKEKHFGRAASNLYITQAAVSARIKQLEAFYRTQLFVRDRNAIKLTSAGEQLLQYAGQIVRTLEQSKAALLLAEQQAVQLTLAGTPNIWDGFLQHGLSHISRALTGYAFKAETLGREQLIRGLLERSLDLAVSFDPLKADELYCQQVSQAELILVASTAVSSQQALSQGYVYVDWGTRFAMEHQERHPQMPPPYLRTSTGRIALDFILSNGGASYLPLTMVADLLAQERLFRVNASSSWLRPIYLSYRKNAACLPQLQQVEQLLSQVQ